ncbi:N-acetyltransferase [Pedobacter chinensis]|uniref:N-acetyltransferase n=1 Tax=Pedobacter chinensis TaxID=2282421 RepID=A0A369Q0F4_9SPHI|nr:GNAT family N-acetyltransferase [Pedobacter chinensis]RDC57982.1 N-acetyltransferase [Pedobacter chinensis]
MIEVRFENNIAPVAFNLYDGGSKIGEMIVEITDGNLKVYHTEIDENQEGKGYAKKLMDAMINHCRTESLKVIPLCTYVALQFKRHPDVYNDIWNKDIKPSF